MKILILFLTLVCAPVLAQLYIEKQDTEIVNLLKNPGLESGLGQWTYTSGTVTTSSTEAIQGSASALFQPTGVSQTLSSKLYFSSGLNGQKCEASLMYTTTEGTNPYIFRVVDSSSTVLASSILVSSTARAKQSLYFNCGANPIQTQLVATVSSPTFIKSDAFHLGSRRLTNKDVEGALGYVPLQSPIDINTNTTGSLAQNRLADSGVVSGTYTKVQVTSAGTVTSGTTLINSDLPDSGIASGTYTKIQINTKGIATSGTTLVESDIPNLQTTKITSGVFTVAFGGTGVSSVTTGSLWVGSGTSTVKNLPIGSTNQVLTAVSGTAVWSDPAASTSLSNVVTLTASTTLTTSNDMVFVTPGSVTLTITLPSAASGTGKIITVQKTDIAPGSVLISTQGGQTIDGSSATRLDVKLESVKIISDGSNWSVLNREFLIPIASKYRVSVVQSSSPTQPLNYDTLIFDDLSLVITGASWNFKAPKTGIYQACVTFVDPGIATYMSIYVNATLTQLLSTVVAASEPSSNCNFIRVNKNDLIDARSAVSMTLNSTSIGTHNNISISFVK